MLSLPLVIADLSLPLWLHSENLHIVLWANVVIWFVDIRALVSGKSFFSRSPISAWVVFAYIKEWEVPAERLWTTITIQPVTRPGELLFSEKASIFKCDDDTHKVRVISLGGLVHCNVEGFIFRKNSTVAKVVELRDKQDGLGPPCPDLSEHIDGATAETLVANFNLKSKLLVGPLGRLFQIHLDP